MRASSANASAAKAQMKSNLERFVRACETMPVNAIRGKTLKLIILVNSSVDM